MKGINMKDDEQGRKGSRSDNNKFIVMENRNGRAIWFHENYGRQMGRNATGVRGMKLDDDGQDEVIGMILVDYPNAEAPNVIEFAAEDEAEIVNDNIPEVEEEIVDETETSEETIEISGEDSILVISENGFGKRSPITSYRITRRGGKGVKTLNLTDKTGPLVALKKVNDSNDIMIINKSGITIRLHVTDLRVMGRATQGVRLINLEKKQDAIASVCKVLTDIEEVEAIENKESNN